MAFYKIPFGGVPDYKTVQTFDDNQAYEIRVRWNTTDEAWYCYVGFPGSDPACKFKITNGFDLLKPYKHLDGCPQGELYIMDLVNGFGRPGYDDIGTDNRFALTYIEVETVDAIAAAS